MITPFFFYLFKTWHLRRGPLHPAVKRGPESGNDTVTKEAVQLPGLTKAGRPGPWLRSRLFHRSTATVQQPRFRRSQLRPPPREEVEGSRSPQYSGPRSYGIPNHCLLDTVGPEQGKDKGSRFPSCQGSADAQSARSRVRASPGTPGSLLTPATNRKYPVRRACGHTTHQAHTHQAGTQRLM